MHQPFGSHLIDRVVIYSLLIAATCMCLGASRLFFAAAEQEVPLLTDVHRVVLSVGGVSSNLRNATDEWKKASSGTVAINEKTQKMLESANTLMEDTDARLNGEDGDLKKMADLLDGLNSSTERIALAAESLSTNGSASLAKYGTLADNLSLHSVALLDSGTRTVDYIRSSISDRMPKVDLIADNLVSASAHAEKASEEAQQALSPGHTRFWLTITTVGAKIGLFFAAVFK
jgi:uncharacterized protein YoxC